MDWKRLPGIVREARIAWIIPELRGPVLKIVAIRIATWISLPITISLMLIPSFIWAIGQVLVWIGEGAMKLPIYPTGPLIRARGKAMDKAEMLMPNEEIRRRSYGEGCAMPAKPDGGE